METLVINVTNDARQWSSPQRGRCEVSFEGAEEGMASLLVEIQHYDNEGNPIDTTSGVFEILLDHDFGGGQPAGFAYDKRNSMYRLGFTPSGTLTDTNYNIHIA